jgi:CRISPR/Cas system-associated exonuclease Cas4 (RecB family)
MEHVSASQVTQFLDCPRKWYLRYVMGFKTPQGPAQLLGSNVHKSLEHFLKTGEILDNEWRAYVEAAKDYLEHREDQLIEQKFTLPTFPGGPIWLGYIDLLIDIEPPIVHDHKTTSDFRYAKTPEEMEKDTQLCSYARWVQEEQLKHLGRSTNVVARLLYLHTRRKTKAKRVRLVETTLTPERVHEIWNRDLEVVRRMIVAEQVDNVEDLLPTTTSCGKYGGCPYRTKCGLVVETNPGRKKKEDMSNFLERMKEKQAEAAAGGNGVPPPQAEGVTPPDGASRTTPIPTEEEKTAAAKVEEDKKKKGRGRPKLTAAEKEANRKKRAAEKALEKAKKAQEEAEAAAKAAAEVAPPAPAPAPEPPAPAPDTSEDAKAITQAVMPASEGFTLYIDCYPVKGNGVSAVLFDDWIIPIIADINKEIDVADYRLLGFASEKMALQAGLEKHITEVPPVLIITSTSSIAKDAQQTLIPHAQQVIRAIR